jgi:citrate lyase subunit beta/citryl-CoA lyase
MVRINALDTRFAHGDLAAVVVPGVDGVILPKGQNSADIQIADWVLGQWERERGLVAGGIEVLPIIETAKGLENVSQILAASRRVQRAAFGAGDWARDTGMAWVPGNPGLVAARFRLAVTSRALGKQPPVDTAFTGIRDGDGFTAEAIAARDLGYQGKFCIHPDQVALANSAFSPSPEEVARARAVWTAFAENEAKGIAAITVDGAFIDYPVAAQARMVLERAGESPPVVEESGRRQGKPAEIRSA